MRPDAADIASRWLGYSLRGSHPCVARVRASPSAATLGLVLASGQPPPSILFRRQKRLPLVAKLHDAETEHKPLSAACDARLSPFHREYGGREERRAAGQRRGTESRDHGVMPSRRLRGTGGLSLSYGIGSFRRSGCPDLGHQWPILARVARRPFKVPSASSEDSSPVFGLLDADLELAPQLPKRLLVQLLSLLKQPQARAHHFAGRLVEAALDLPLHLPLQVGGQKIHGHRELLRAQDSTDGRKEQFWLGARRRQVDWRLDLDIVPERPPPPWPANR